MTPICVAVTVTLVPLAHRLSLFHSVVVSKRKEGNDAALRLGPGAWRVTAIDERFRWVAELRRGN